MLNYRAENLLPKRLNVDAANAMAAIHKTAFATSWTSEDMVSHCQKDFCLGIGEPLQAFAIIQHVADQAEILTIVTAPQYRKKGLAKRLLSEIEYELGKAGVEIIFLEVAEDNPSAIALYKRCGYEQFGKRPAYYKRPNGRIAALTYRKKLDDRGQIR